MLSNFFRHTVTSLLWAAFVAVAMLTTIWAVLEHYLNLRGALELSGFETQELWRDPLVGQLLAAFIPGASLPQALALGIATTEALALFLMVELVVSLVGLIWLRREAVAVNDLAQARDANHRIVWRGTVLVVIALVIGPALRLDFELFRFRALAGALGVELPEEAVQIPTWDAVLAEPDLPYSVVLAGVGAWGYLAFTLLLCVALDAGFRQFNEHCILAGNSLKAWWESDATTPAELPGDEAGDYTNDESEGANHPGEAPSEDGGTEPQPLAPDTAEPGESGSVTSSVPDRTGDAGSAVLFERPMEPRPNRREAPPRSGQPASGSGKRPATAGQPQAPASQTPAAPLRPVIGSVGDEQITLPYARRDTGQFFVEPATGRIWDRGYWERLQGESNGDGSAREET